MVSTFRIPGAFAPLILALAVPLAAEAATIYVPDDFPTIEGAIGAAASGDTVLVRPGTYFEFPLEMASKDVALHSTAGPDQTIIDVRGMGTVVHLYDIGPLAEVRGFTLTGGQAGIGGGVLVNPPSFGAGPLIEGNRIVGNVAGVGGGVLIQTPARIVRNLIASNTASVMHGGGIYMDTGPENDSQIIVSENEIVGNVAAWTTSEGGGAWIQTAHSLLFTDNIVACNEANESGGVSIIAPATDGVTEIVRNTFVLNWGRSDIGAMKLVFRSNILIVLYANIIAFNIGGGIYCQDTRWGDGDLDADCNVLAGNSPDLLNEDCGIVFGTDGNQRVDPLFGGVSCDPETPQSFCLEAGSPCLPDHSPPGCGLIGARGECGPISVEEPGLSAPTVFQALPPRPNPFSEMTTIPFRFARDSVVEVLIHNVLGQRVRTLSLGWMAAGDHSVEWDGRTDNANRAPSGAYIARIRAAGQELPRTLLLVR